MDHEALSPKPRFHYFGDGRLRFVKYLFREWHNILTESESVLGSYWDSPYWYGERTHVGLLATAATALKDTMVLQEYSVYRGRGQKVVRGRADLWLHDRKAGRAYDFEFKVVYPSVRSRRTVLLRSQVKSAAKDVRSLPLPKFPSWGIAVVFVVPGVRDTPPQEKWGTVWQGFATHMSEPRKFGADFAVVHQASEKVVRRIAGDRDEYGFHPGIAALGKIVRRR